MIKNPKLGNTVYYIDILEIKSATILGIQIQYVDFTDFANNTPNGTITLGEAHLGDGSKVSDTFKISKITGIKDVYASEFAAEKALKIKLNHLTRKQKENLK